MSQPGPAADAPKLTAVILTLNEAAHIQACIDSLRWADHILIFDAYSSDGTLSLAQAAGAEVRQSRFENYAQQRNAALAAVGGEWVFFVDADERATAELAAEARAVVALRPEVGWHVPRHNIIFGRLTRGGGWRPDYQLRLFRREQVRYEQPVHEVAVVDGPVGYLRQPLIHFNYRDPAHFHAKQRRYVEYDAQMLAAAGARLKGHSRFSMAARQFWWRFVRLGGYRDGPHGLRLSLYLAYYEWLKYRRLGELSGRSNRPQAGEPPPAGGRPPAGLA
ncbi:MAG: glycosyltransferase family 2 protein [Candidatus Promineifilaceae bacterium]